MFKESQILRNFLSGKNLRSSSIRNIILEAFLKEEGHITAEKLYRKVSKKNSSIGIATVYRSLKIFKDAGLARVSTFGKDETHYEHNYLHQHHDHLICLKCGDIIEFKNPDIEKMQDKIAKKHRFQISSHRLEIFGRCTNCALK